MKNIFMRIDHNHINFDKIIVLFLTIAMFLLNLLFDFSNKFLIYISSIMVMYISIKLAICYKNNIIAFLMFFLILYFNYSIIFSRYLYVLSEQYREFYINIDVKTYGIGIVILLIFMVCIYMIENKKYRYITYEKNYFYSKNTNLLIVILMIFLLIIINLIGFDYSSYGKRGATSSIYEYSGIVFIISYHFCGNSKISTLLKTIINIILLFFCIQGFIFGERISGIQFLIIFFIFNLSHIIRYKHILLIAFIGLIAMMVIDSYRGSYSIERITLETILNSLSKRRFTFNGADLAYYTSLTFVMVHNLNSFAERLMLFYKFLISIFLGTARVEGSFLAEYTRQYYMHWYGGVYPFVFYFYLGWFGVVTFSILLGKIIKYTINMKEQKSSYLKLLKVYIISIMPRWYMYSPQILFRAILLFSIFMFLVKILNILTSSRMKKKYL